MNRTAVIQYVDQADRVVPNNPWEVLLKENGGKVVARGHFKHLEVKMLHMGIATWILSGDVNPRFNRE